MRQRLVLAVSLAAIASACASASVAREETTPTSSTIAAPGGLPDDLNERFEVAVEVITDQLGDELISGSGFASTEGTIMPAVSLNVGTAADAAPHCDTITEVLEAHFPGNAMQLRIDGWVADDDGFYSAADWDSFICGE